MKLLLLVSAGGAIGAGARHLVNLAVLKWLGPGFPWATLFVNVLGSCAMGLLLGIIGTRYDGSADLRAFLLTGILGGFTTFSAFSMDAMNLWQRGEGIAAAAYIATSVAASLVAFTAGAYLARA